MYKNIIRNYMNIARENIGCQQFEKNSIRNCKMIAKKLAGKNLKI